MNKLHSKKSLVIWTLALRAECSTEIRLLVVDMFPCGHTDYVCKSSEKSTFSTFSDSSLLFHSNGSPTLPWAPCLLQLSQTVAIFPTDPPTPPSRSPDIRQESSLLVTANPRTFSNPCLLPKKSQLWISLKSIITHYSHCCCHLLTLDHLLPSQLASFTCNSTRSLQHHSWWFQWHPGAPSNMLASQLFEFLAPSGVICLLFHFSHSLPWLHRELFNAKNYNLSTISISSNPLSGHLSSSHLPNSKNPYPHLLIILPLHSPSCSWWPLFPS